MSLAWPISEKEQDACTRFGLPDGVGPAADAGRLRTFEELHIDDWRRSALAILVPDDRPFGILASSPSWRLTGLWRFSRDGRAAWSAGVRWRYAGAGRIWAIAPASATVTEIATARATILASVGYRDEPGPEFVIVPAAAAASGDVDNAMWSRVRSWCRTPTQYATPETLLTAGVAERVIVLHDGGLFVAVPSSAAAEIRRRIEALASGWNVRTVPGPATGAYFRTS